jgi:RNA polymerase sigma factor (TIGR02999 family)
MPPAAGAANGPPGTRLQTQLVRWRPPPKPAKSTGGDERFARELAARAVDWKDRAHFFAISAQTMRRILVDSARERVTEKRGGGRPQLSLDEALDARPARPDELVELDDALHELAKLDPRKARVVELRFFGGLSAEETAEVLEVSTKTVLRDWSMARAWLSRELNRACR